MEKKPKYIDHKKEEERKHIKYEEKHFLGQERIWAVEPKAIHTQPII